MWPTQMSSWNNYVYGDCVSAEEAFAKATAAPQTFIPLDTVVAWAKAHGYLNGATLASVLTTMETNGLPLNGKTYDDGPHYSVNWTNAATLKSAIYSHGPVKIGVGAEYFQTNTHGKVTPGTSGWTMYDYPPHQTEDHCVSLCGYGTWRNWSAFSTIITLPSIRRRDSPQACPTRCSPGTRSGSSISSQC